MLLSLKASSTELEKNTGQAGFRQLWLLLSLVALLQRYQVEKELVTSYWDGNKGTKNVFMDTEFQDFSSHLRDFTGTTAICLLDVSDRNTFLNLDSPPPPSCVVQPDVLMFQTYPYPSSSL